MWDADQLVHDALGDAGGEQLVSAKDDADRVEELLGRIVFEDEAAGALALFTLGLGRYTAASGRWTGR
jgi:hypothetical protein